MPHRITLKRSVGNSYQANRSFENDLFKSKKRPSKLRLFAWIFLFTVLSGGAGWFFTRPFFFIAHIEIDGLETISRDTILNDVWTKGREDTLLGISRLHILRRKETFIHEALSAYSFASIEVTQQKRSLSITVTERAQGGLVHAMNTWALYDLQGNFVRTLTDEEIAYTGSVINNAPISAPLFYKDTPIIEFGNQAVAIEKVFPALIAIKEMHDSLIHAGEHPLLHIISDDTYTWGQVTMREGYTVLYDLLTPPKAQIDRLSTVKREIQLKATPYTSIDIRFEGRAYVK